MISNKNVQSSISIFCINKTILIYLPELSLAEIVEVTEDVVELVMVDVVDVEVVENGLTCD